MSTTEEDNGTGLDEADTVDGESLDTLPEVALDWLCDDEDDCQEITVFEPGAENPTTTWISVDAAVAIPLEEIL